MKKLSVLFAAIVMCASVGLNAQKTATIDVAGVLNAMPEKKKLDQQLEAFSKAKAAEILKQGETAQALYEKYSNDAVTQTAEVNKIRQKELEKISDDLDKLKGDAQKELMTKEDAGLAPIEAKFNAAVKKAAIVNGWEYVIDASSPALIYKGGPDATPAVKKELGL